MKKHLRDLFSNLSRDQKIQVIVAAVLTLAIIVIMPTVAWFTFQSKYETMTYVNDPPRLSLAGGYMDSIQCFELKNIDVKRETNGSYYQDFVFSVETEKAREYDIQLAHTTNIPFVYELYRAKEDINGEVTYKVQEGDNKGQTLKYKILTGALSDGDATIAQDITLTNLNLKDDSSRQIGSESTLKTNFNRENYEEGDKYDQYVEPLYSVARHIKTNIRTFDGSDDRDYYILRVKWNVNNEAQGSSYWKYAFNNKETDIVYISVKESRDIGNNE